MKTFLKSLFMITLFSLPVIIYASPVWTFKPLTATHISIPKNSSATVQYEVTNQSKKPHVLSMTPIVGVLQNTNTGNCGNPFLLTYLQSCVLTLQINGSLVNNIIGGPIVCDNSNPLMCYQPSFPDILNITTTSPSTNVLISVSGSPLTLQTNGLSGSLFVTNLSLTDFATNITADFTGTALDGNVTETGNTCANVAPGASCVLTFTPGSQRVPLTSFPIQGTNTNIINASIAIQSLSAYIGNNTNDVTQCIVQSNGLFSSGCTPSGTGLVNPAGMFINSAATLLYIANFDIVTNTVSRCLFDMLNGDLINCQNSGSNLISPADIVLNNTDTFAYITDSPSNDVVKCDILGDGNLNICTPMTIPGLDFPSGITFNLTETFVYIANAGVSSSVTKCAIDGLGNFINCNNNFSGSSSNLYIDTAINASNTLIYIVDSGTVFNITKCELDGTGEIVNCAPPFLDASFNQPRFIVLNADDTMLYVTNPGNNTVSACNLDGLGNILSCTATGDNLNAPLGIALRLF